MVRSLLTKVRSLPSWGGWTLIERPRWDVGVRYHWRSFLVGWAVRTDWTGHWHYLEVEANAGFVHLSCHYSHWPKADRGS